MRIWLISFAAILVLLAIGASIFLVGRGLTNVLKETENTIKETRETISELKQRIKEAKAVEAQLKFAIMSWHGVSFDLRKNWTANEKIQEKTLATLVKITNATEKAIITITEEFALTMDRTRNTIIPAAEDALKELRSAVTEAKLAIHDLSIETTATLAGVRPVLQATEKTINGIGSETQTVLKKVQPIEDNLGDLSKNIASMSQRLDNVLAKYEKTILHPSWKQRAKGVFQLILSSFNLWADMRLIF